MFPSALQSVASVSTLTLHFARYLRIAIKSSRFTMPSPLTSPYIIGVMIVVGSVVAGSVVVGAAEVGSTVVVGTAVVGANVVFGATVVVGAAVVGSVVVGADVVGADVVGAADVVSVVGSSSPTGTTASP